MTVFVSFYFNDENQNFGINVPVEWLESHELFVEILKSSFGDLFVELTNIEILEKPLWLVEYNSEIPWFV